MSRLDSFIRRMSAQRDLLDHAAGLVDGVAGPVIELGLGSGRTYDHLKARLPGREVFVFDTLFSTVAIDQLPDREHMVLGDIRDTLPFCLPRIKLPAALLHNDIGAGDDTVNAATEAWLAPIVPGLMAPGGLVVTSFTMDLPGYELLDVPASIPAGRYYLYRAPV
ncbi:SAM-dependent methyltransferase [Rhodobium orientis]|uniref:S-adenosyl-L-methionine methyltransferase n=1 Tax=Rhodobium orientis TaxID=34017 RepID=A0A327JYL9_9HYPH|nr:class I SAM-dependent methyltransferase [Rhodobium orientis]MBB4301741.1 SAM-dependent methyltransferase [Rhodobium orientis]MBK5950544.1 hypothetical protein [Rhodobium orientis]RAI28188.1 hypothetical protein CH339_07530 [Rhodobium orientis]